MYDFRKRVLSSVHFFRRSVVVFSARPVFWGLHLCIRCLAIDTPQSVILWYKVWQIILTSCLSHFWRVRRFFCLKAFHRWLVIYLQFRSALNFWPIVYPSFGLLQGLHNFFDWMARWPSERCPNFDSLLIFLDLKQIIMICNFPFRHSLKSFYIILK